MREMRNILGWGFRRALIMPLLFVALAGAGWGEEITVSTGPKCIATEKGLAFYDKTGKLTKTLSPPGLVDWKATPAGDYGALLTEAVTVGFRGILASTRGFHLYDLHGNLLWEKRSAWSSSNKDTRTRRWVSYGIPWRTKEHKICMSKNAERIVLIEEFYDPITYPSSQKEVSVIIFDRQGNEIWRLWPYTGEITQNYITENGKYGYFFLYLGRSDTPIWKGFKFFNLVKRSTKELSFDDFPQHPDFPEDPTAEVISKNVGVKEDGTVILYLQERRWTSEDELKLKLVSERAVGQINLK